MTDSHAQLEAWLVDGAMGDPPRETAVHATLCESCTARLGAFDALALIDVAAAGSPPPQAAPSRVRTGVAWARLGSAVVGTVVAGIILAFGASQLLGLATPAGEPNATHLVAVASDESGQSLDLSSTELDATATPTAGASATPQAGVTPGPLPIPPPDATPRPPTPQPSATGGPTPTPAPTPTPTPAPTPTPTPVPQCDDGIDNDSDGFSDLLDPGCSSASDDDEFNFFACNDAIDNDGDGYTDLADPGCNGDQFGNSELPLHYECNDGIDNDGDLATDYPNDPECTDPTDPDEST
jgi:hypothetical protein